MRVCLCAPFFFDPFGLLRDQPESLVVRSPFKDIGTGGRGLVRQQVLTLFGFGWHTRKRVTACCLKLRLSTREIQQRLKHQFATYNGEMYYRLPVPLLVTYVVELHTLFDIRSTYAEGVQTTNNGCGKGNGGAETRSNGLLAKDRPFWKKPR
eukprot:1164955-Amphidinium_carterae.1